MKLKQFEQYLQNLDDFRNPNFKLEQYSTPVHLASHILYTIQSQYDDFAGKIVADLGTGCGTLAIGASLLDANHVIGFEIDEGALDVCKGNLEYFELNNVDLFQCDVLQFFRPRSRVLVSKRSLGLVPIVIESTGRGERSYDIFSRLLRERIICLMGDIQDHISSLIVAQLLYLQSESSNQPINMYINSPGGSVTAGLAIYDTMQYISPPVCTWCVGQACSMGSLLLSAGAPGKRYALPNSRIMIHQPSGGVQGQATDIKIQADEILKMKAKINNLYKTHTKQSLEKIEKLMERDLFMSPLEAKEMGLIDVVLKLPDPAENFYKKFDTVVMNPPFGTKNNAGIDMEFLKIASELTTNTIYSLHKTSTRNHVLKEARKLNMDAKVLAELKYDIKKTYKFHKKNSVDICVDFIRLQSLEN